MWNCTRNSEQKEGYKLEGRVKESWEYFRTQFSNVLDGSISVPSNNTPSLFCTAKVWLFIWTSSICSSHTYILKTRDWEMTWTVMWIGEFAVEYQDLSLDPGISVISQGQEHPSLYLSTKESRDRRIARARRPPA